MDVTIKVTGLDKMADAIMKLAEAMEGKAVSTVAVPEVKKENEQNVQPMAQQQPVQYQSYGQQIAEHFPNANTGMQNPQPVTQQQIVGTQTQQPVQQPAVQTSTQTYTLDDLSRAAMLLMDTGMQAQLQQLLLNHGVESLPQLPVEQYGAFATELRGLGAQI